MNQNHHRAPVLLPAFVILVGLLLRVGMLGVDMRFHPDEALFAAQARLISHEGDWLLRTTDLDKPPLTFYVMALFFRLLGPTEFAARLPNTMFSALSIAVLIVLARSLYHDVSLAALAGLLLVLSPYDVAFSATVFTDVQATFWTLLAALLAVRDRWRAAGIAAALMLAAKPTAVLFLPLALALGIAQNAETDWRLRDVVWCLWRFVWPFVLGIGMVVLWDIGRAPRSFLELGSQRNNPGRLIRSDEVWPRLEQWGHWLGAITGSRVVNGLALANGAIWLVRGMKRRSRTVVVDWLIGGFGITWLAWHWLIAFNTYDRYVHTLAPFAALLIGRIGISVSRSFVGVVGLQRTTYSLPVMLLTLGLCVLIIPGTITTLRGDAPFGGDQGQHTGIDALAEYLNEELGGEIVYDHWLGWELVYYLGQDPQVQLIYQPLPEALVDDMRVQSGRRYFVALSPQAAAPWLDALRRSEIGVATVYHAQFVIYALEP